MTTLSAETQRFVLEQLLGYHATVSPDGMPCLAHAGTTSVYDDEHLFFADIRSPRTVANLRVNPAIEVNVVDIFARRGYRFRGTATIHQDDEVYQRALKLLADRGRLRTGKHQVKGIVLIHVQHADTITSPAYDNGQTESELVQHYLGYYTSLHPAAPPKEPGQDAPPA
jgi:uncharacterized protein